jgi:hypothetical protein
MDDYWAKKGKTDNAEEAKDEGEVNEWIFQLRILFKTSGRHPDVLNLMLLMNG